MKTLSFVPDKSHADLLWCAIEVLRPWLVGAARALDVLRPWLVPVLALLAVTAFDALRPGLVAKTLLRRLLPGVILGIVVFILRLQFHLTTQDTWINYRYIQLYLTIRIVLHRLPQWTKHINYSRVQVDRDTVRIKWIVNDTEWLIKCNLDVISWLNNLQLHAN